MKRISYSRSVGDIHESWVVETDGYVTDFQTILEALDDSVRRIPTPKSVVDRLNPPPEEKTGDDIPF